MLFSKPVKNDIIRIQNREDISLQKHCFLLSFYDIFENKKVNFLKRKKTKNIQQKNSSIERVWSWKELQENKLVEPVEREVVLRLKELKKTRSGIGLIALIDLKKFKAKIFSVILSETKNPELNITNRIITRSSRRTAVLLRMTIWFKDHWILLIKSATQNHLRIQNIETKPSPGESCNLNFSSYSQLKRYQKKVRLFTFSASSTMASVLIAMTLMQIIFPGGITYGATFHFAQTNWATQTANIANHNANQTGWNQYQIKDAGITTINGGEDVQLQQVSQTTTQTTDTDFNAGTKTDTAIAGSGDSASVNLAQSPRKINEYTVGKLVDVPVTVTAVGAASPWLLTLSGTPNLSRTFKNDEFQDSAGKKWKVLSLNPSTTTPRLLVIDSEGNGGTPATGAGHTGRWYTDLAAWETGRQGDLLARNAIERALPYYDVGPDTIPLDINGWVTDAMHYVEINVPLSERHRGRWDDGRYRLDINTVNGYALSMRVSNVKINGLQVRLTKNQYSYSIITIKDAVSAEVDFSNNIVRGNFTGTGSGTGIDVYNLNNPQKVSIYNNYVFDVVNSGQITRGLVNSGSTGGRIFAYNNTIVNSGFGIVTDFYSITVKNNIVQDCSGGYVSTGGGVFAAASTNNLSNLADAPGTNPQNSKTVAFVEAANKDFHLEFNDTAAKNAGADLSADAPPAGGLPITTDIDGDTRTGTWDIGADDVGATYVHTSSIGTNGRDFATLQAWEDARDSLLTTRQVYKITSQSGAFTNSEYITGQTSGAKGDYQRERAIPLANEKYMSVDPWNPAQSFVLGETVVGSVSGQTAVISSIITTSGTIEKGEAYNDSVFTAGVAISGSTADASHYMWLSVEPRSRHSGVPGTGSRIIMSSGGDAVGIQNRYVTIDWLEIDESGYAANGINQFWDSSYFTARNNLLYKKPGTSYQTGVGINGGANFSKVYNNIVQGFNNGITAYYGNDNLYDNSIINCINGIYNSSNSSSPFSYNNLSINSTIASFGTAGGAWNASSSNNISSDAIAPGTNSLTSQFLSNIKFVSTDPSLIDLHIQDGSVAQGAGANLSLTFTNDIDQQTRPASGAWSTGADEKVVEPNYYKPTGTFESGTIDLGVKADLSSLKFNGSTPAGTILKTQVAVNNDNATWNYVDYGQPQSGIPIYYSVGQNTNNHSSGGNVSISGGIANFTIPQTATNLGVGDALIAGGNTYYLAQKITTSQWKVITKLGAIPGDLGSNVVTSIAHAFSSLNAAIVGAKDASHLNTSDLVSSNYQLNLPCYYDTGADTTAVNVTGYMTGVLNYIKIYTPNNVSSEVNQSQRHQGKWDDMKFALRADEYFGSIRVNVDNFQVDGLQIENVRSGLSTGNQAGIFVENSIGKNLIFSFNVVREIGKSIVVYENAGIRISHIGSVNTNTKIIIHNNVIYGFYGGIRYNVTGGLAINELIAYNNTIKSNYEDFRLSLYSSSDVLRLKNNIAQGSAGYYLESTAETADYLNNISLNATSPNVALRNKAVSFVDAPNNDFHLSPSDTAGKNAGADLSVDANLPFSTDIDGQFRTGAWDIGADEEGAPASLGNNRYIRYKTILQSTSDISQTPVLNDLTLKYASYPSSASLHPHMILLMRPIFWLSFNGQKQKQQTLM